MMTIPSEIIENVILPRLPAKSLMRFKCVSKPWLTLISSHEFIHLHLYNALTSNNSNHLLILTGNDCCLYSFSLDLPEAPAVKLPSFGFKPFVVGSCNGLLCIQSQSPYTLVLLNPSTGSYREIPSLRQPRRCSALNFGFGYDCTNDDYKVVRIVDRYPSLGFISAQMDRIVHVYSLRTNSWEIVEWTEPQDSMGVRENGTVINNSLVHWKFWSPQEGLYRIHCFDLCQKQWTDDVPLPDINSHMARENIRDALLDFGVLDERLYLSATDSEKSVVDIWIMNEYGVKESWVKKFQISDSRVSRSLRVSPIVCLSRKHQILLRTGNKDEHKIYWYNTEGEAAEIAEINGVADCLWIDVCKSSLVNVPGGSQIEKSKQEEKKEGI